MDQMCLDRPENIKIRFQFCIIFCFDAHVLRLVQFQVLENGRKNGFIKKPPQIFEVPLAEFGKGFC